MSSTALTRATAKSSRAAADARIIRAWQIALLAGLIILWESSARLGDVSWTSSPSLVVTRLWLWTTTSLWMHALTTFNEMAVGLAFGVPLGIATGLVLGRLARLATFLRPLIVAVYCVPLVTLAPILIVWFGLDMLPKVILVSVVSFFLLFFNTLSGVQSLDRDTVQALGIMGADKSELFRKVILPASTVWITAGLRTALPYALIAATVGEMISSRRGLGYLLTQAASQIDMTGLYAALLVLMAMGIALNAVSDILESRLLHWRNTSE